MARLVKIVAFGKDYCLQPVHSNYARKDRGTSCVWQLSLFFDFFYRKSQPPLFLLRSKWTHILFHRQICPERVITRVTEFPGMY